MGNLVCGFPGMAYPEWHTTSYKPNLGDEFCSCCGSEYTDSRYFEGKGISIVEGVLNDKELDATIFQKTEFAPPDHPPINFVFRISGKDLYRYEDDEYDDEDAF